MNPKATPMTSREKAAVEKLLRELRKQPETLPAPDDKTVARVTVNVPSKARLYVDGVQCPLQSTTRTFNTPQLEPGKKYYYTLRAEMNQNGQTIAQTERVFVEAGQQVTVTLGDLKAVQTAQR